ncbi:MAG: hypothetical protein U0736_07575 [Gemmataceae bacterium]
MTHPSRCAPLVPAACERVRLSDDDADFEREARHGRVDTGRYRHRPATSGATGRPLVFIHGVSDVSRSFVLVIHVAAHFRCIAYDLPLGHRDGGNIATSTATSSTTCGRYSAICRSIAATSSGRRLARRWRTAAMRRQPHRASRGRFCKGWPTARCGRSSERSPGLFRHLREQPPGCRGDECWNWLTASRSPTRPTRWRAYVAWTGESRLAAAQDTRRDCCTASTCGRSCPISASRCC